MPQLAQAIARTLLRFLLLIALLPVARAQDTLSTVGGVVTDPTGAVIPDALLTLHAAQPAIRDRTSHTTHTGRYAFAAPPGEYTLSASAPGFAPSAAIPFHLDSATPGTLNIPLRIATELLQIDVPDQPATTDPATIGNSIILRGRALDDLPLDPSQMMQQLQALAGSNSPEIYVDGFSGGTLPRRDAIREIRINQNPYSAQNDVNPVNGQIQAFTKPGSDRFHGDIYALGNDSAVNSLNPFVTAESPYYSYNYFLTISGPLTKHSSFFTNGGHHTNQAQSIINAQTLDTDLEPMNFRQAVSTPSTSDSFSTRIDAALGAKDTVVLRYNLDRTHDTAGGIGQLALATQAYSNRGSTQTLQLSNTAVLTSRIVNDTRFQYIRSRIRQTPASFAPTVIVQGAFIDGGSNSGAFNDSQDRYELQNYTSTVLGKHFLNFGVRLRDTRDSNQSRANYGGEFVFSDLEAYEYTRQCIDAGLAPAQIRASGGGASQFNITAGSPAVTVNLLDAALFVQDDWKARSNLTLSAGLRFETQNLIADHADLGPRLGFVYTFGARAGKNGKRPSTGPYTLRAGSGIFFRRFTSEYALQAARLDGITQQQYVVDNPDFYPNLPSLSCQDPSTQCTTYQVDPNFHAPYFLSSTLSLDRRLGNYGLLTFTFNDKRGVHTQLTRNINAPLPGTYNTAVPTSGIRPFGGTRNIYQYESTGLYRDNRLSVNLNAHYKSRMYLNAFYEYRRAQTDDNAGGFPSDPYNLRLDYGRVPNTPAHQFNGGTGFDLPFALQQYVFLRAASGLPFNIVLPQDLNGDSQFNDRPTFATDHTRPSVVTTRYGTFDTAPAQGQTVIPFDYGTGPTLFTVYLQLARDFHFGPAIQSASALPALTPGEKRAVDRPYTLNLAITVDNALNHPNYAPPIGTLTSPLFGQPNALAPGFSPSANRVVSFQTFFHF